MLTLSRDKVLSYRLLLLLTAILMNFLDFFGRFVLVFDVILWYNDIKMTFTECQVSGGMLMMKRFVALLMVLCMMCGAMNAVADTAATVTVGPYTFDVPSGMTCGQARQVNDEISVMEASGSTWMGSYNMSCVTIKYDPSEVESEGVMVYQNFYVLTALLLGQQNMSLMNPRDSYISMDQGPNLMMGEVSQGNNQKIMALSYYYDNAGFMMMVIGDSGTWTAARDMAVTARRASANAASSSNVPMVVITSTSAKVRTIPSATADIIKTAYRGESFELVRENREWYAVKVDGRIGYINKIVAKIVESVPMIVITAASGKIRTEASVSGGLIKTAYKGETYELIEQRGDWYVVKVDGRTGYIHKGVAAIQ